MGGCAQADAQPLGGDNSQWFRTEGGSSFTNALASFCMMLLGEDNSFLILQ